MPIPPGEYRVLGAPEETWLVANLDGELAAVRNLCSHQPRPLTGGDLRGAVLACPHHLTAYDLRTGAVVEDGGFTHLEPLEARPVVVRAGRFCLAEP